MANANTEVTFSKARLRVVKVDKLGPAYLKDDVTQLAVNLIEKDIYFGKRVNKMGKDVDTAAARIVEMTANYEKMLDKFFAMELKLAEHTKKVSGTVRDAAEKLGNGLQRIEKTANFDKLERYTLLLERTAAAMQTLSEIEASGKLDKITNALK